jgi:putative pyruvate formate lyase activating enzyme
VVYNTGGFERVETLKRLEGYVDIWLPDAKYADPNRAKNYSAAENYP